MSSGGSAGAPKRELLLWAVQDGAAAERRGDWPSAVAAYQEAAELQDELFEAQTTRLFAERLLGSSPDLTSRLAYAYVRAGRPDDALVAVETGRARMLTSAAMLSGIDLTAITDPVLREQLGQVLAALRHYEQGRTDPLWVATASSGSQIKMLRDEIRRLRALPQARDLMVRASGTLRRDAAGRTVVALCAGAVGGAALVVPADPNDPLHAVLLPDADLVSVADNARAVVRVNQQLLRRNPRTALDGIDACCAWLAAAVVEPVRDRLPYRQPVTFVATSWFGLLPLRAAWTARPRDPGRWYPLDGVSVSSIPNLRLLGTVGRRQARQRQGPALVVADPAGNPGQDLPFARAEAEAIRRRRPGSVLLVGPSATRAAVMRGLPGCTVAHFCCHALSDAGQPLNSGVLLADGEWLRVHDIMGLSLDSSPLVVLSACETAGIGLTAPDEGVGLPAAFLQAGARGAVASTWPVTDDSTSLLMSRFHDEFGREAGDPPLALSLAQAWLRDASPQMLRDAARRYGMAAPEVLPPGRAPYAHPFFWAAFGYTG
jgi:CHAT domain-containing protein